MEFTDLKHHYFLEINPKMDYGQMVLIWNKSKNL